MDQLVMKAHFEEAKYKGMTAAKTTTTPPKKVHQSGLSPSTSHSTSSASKSSRQVPKTSSPDPTSLKASGNSRKCYKCGLSGHMARARPYPKSLLRRQGGQYQ